MAELKPCPFCGGKAACCCDFDYHEVYCISCYANIKRDGKEDAIEAWNRRLNYGK